MLATVCAVGHRDTQSTVVRLCRLRSIEEAVTHTDRRVNASDLESVGLAREYLGMDKPETAAFLVSLAQTSSS